MDKNQIKTERRNKIRRRIRASISGTPAKPRLAVYKSNKFTYLQLIDDANGATLVAVQGPADVKSAKIAGQNLAKNATNKGITTVVFDRSGYNYHGIVKAAAEGAREGGLKF